MKYKLKKTSTHVCNYENVAMLNFVLFCRYKNKTRMEEVALAAEEPLLEPLSLSQPLPTPPTPAPGNSAALVMDQEPEIVFSTHHNDPLPGDEGILLFIVSFSTVTCIHKIWSDPSSQY